MYPTRHGCGHQRGLFYIGESLNNLQLLAGFVFAVNVLGYLIRIIFDERTGSLHNVLGRAVVALEFEELQTGITLLHAQDILNVCAAKRINALSIVTHHTQMSVTAHQSAHNEALRKIGVLILIYEHILKPF